MQCIITDKQLNQIKETRSVTMNIFRKKSSLFKSFEKVELSYVLTINMFITAEITRKSEFSF